MKLFLIIILTFLGLYKPTPNTKIAISVSSPSPTPISTPVERATPTASSIIYKKGTSSTHVRTETNGVVHDVTINGNGSYNLDEGGTVIHINNN